MLLGALVVSPSARAVEVPPAPACTTAEALEGLGRLDAAEAAYLEALKTESGLGCATAGLEKLGRREISCDVAKALADTGQKAKAEGAYEKVLAADPDSTWAAAGLKALGGKSDTETIESLGKKLTSGLTALGAALGALLLTVIGLAVVYLILLQGLTRCRWTRNRRPATWAVRPSLEVTELDAKWMAKDYGPQFAGLVRASITPGGGANVNLVTGHAGLSEQLKPIEEISQAKAAAAVVSFLLATLPRRKFEVSGALQPAGADGIGVSVVLTNDGRSVDAETLWAHTFEATDDSAEAEAIQALAVPVAAWVAHRTTLALGGGAKLITANSMSFALFKAGAYWQGKDHSDKAASLYGRRSSKTR